MDIELKWEKYKNEKMQNDTIKKLNYILPSLVVIFFIFFMIAVELDKYTMAVNSAFLCMFNLVALVLIISYLENSNKNKKETFFGKLYIPSVFCFFYVKKNLGNLKTNHK